MIEEDEVKNEYQEAFSDENEAYHIAQISADIAEQLGFDESAKNEIKMAVSEIAINAVRYAGGGTAFICCPNDSRIFEIRITDQGKGISSVSEALTEGYSTFPGSLGVGLNVAKRGMDEMVINSLKTGTDIILRKFLPIPFHKAQFGIVTIADEHYDINGDDFCIREFDGNKIILAVIDGLGQGEPAALVAQLAKEIILSKYRLPLDELIIECDQAIRKEIADSGVALALILAQENEILFASVGDIHVKIFTGSKDHYLLSQPGIIGNFALPHIRVQSIEFEGEAIIILCSDGIHDHFNAEDLETSASAQNIAVEIINNYHRSYGDATVLVAKIKDL